MGQGKKGTGMSQENGSERVSGYVVGSNKGGQEWIVRVKKPGHRLDGCKLPVLTIHVGTVLRPGLNVSFELPYFATTAKTFAADVMVMPQAEDKPKTPATIAEDVASIGVMAVKHGGKYSLTFTGARSVPEAQSVLKNMGADKEVVVSVIAMSASEGSGLYDEAAIRALDALVQINEEQEDSLCQTLERFLTIAFEAGIKVGRNQK